MDKQNFILEPFIELAKTNGPESITNMLIEFTKEWIELDDKVVESENPRENYEQNALSLGTTSSENGFDKSKYVVNESMDIIYKQHQISNKIKSIINALDEDTLNQVKAQVSEISNKANDSLKESLLGSSEALTNRQVCNLLNYFFNHCALKVKSIDSPVMGDE